jgi:dTDP-4-dehydrorhamnose reductase
MSRPLVLLLGGSGMLGSAVRRELVQAGFSVDAPSSSQANALAGAWKSLDVSRYGLVVNAASRNRVGEVDTEAYVVNAVMPHALAAACVRHGVRMVHISTNAVFSRSLDGTSVAYGQAPFTESSPTATPASAGPYASTKILGEPVAGALVVRTSIIGPQEKGTAPQFLRACLAAERFVGWTDHIWNGVTTPVLARLVRMVAQGDIWAEGVRHVHSPDALSKHRLASLIVDAFGVDIRVDPQAGPQGPLDLRLATDHPGFLSALCIPSLEDQVAELASHSTPEGFWPDFRGDQS